MSNLQQAAEAMKRAREIVAGRIRANLQRRHLVLTPEALDTLVEEETTASLASLEVAEGEAGFATPDWQADEDGWKPRERTPASTTFTWRPDAS